MAHKPTLSHYRARLSSADRQRASTLAQTLRREQPRLAPRDEFSRLRAWRLGDGPVLHLDDLSEITLPETYGSLEYLEDRARLRAADGDLIATGVRPADGYESYCRDRLGLGSVRWLRAHPPGPRRHLAASCWIDRRMRAKLRHADFQYLHPHMGSFAVWALADLLTRSPRRPLQVIAPPPSLARAANNKLWFADVVSRLLGKAMLPNTHAVSNLVTMAYVVRQLSADSEQLVIKLTDSVGGGGNLVLDAARFRRLPLGRIRLQLQSLLARLDWRGETQILVGSWETEVLAAPSVQLWIPPLEAGEPRIEGLFEQVFKGGEGFFVGTRPARLSEQTSGEVVDSAWLLGYLLQHLGYVGRCSFDLLLVGRDVDHCKVEFVECNGRWGGTSLPMTMLTRLLDDWHSRPFACLSCPLPVDRDTADEQPGRPARLAFPRLLEALDPILFDKRTGAGELILHNAAGLPHGIVDVTGLGDRYADDPHELSLRLEELLSSDHGRARPV